MRRLDGPHLDCSFAGRRILRAMLCVKGVSIDRAAIDPFLDDHNAPSKRFQRVADPDKIIAADRRGRQALALIRARQERRVRARRGKGWKAGANCKVSFFLNNGVFPMKHTVIIGLIFWIGATASAFADVQIVVSYTSVEDRIEPKVKTVSSDRKFTFVITKDRQLKVRYDSGKRGSVGSFQPIGDVHEGHSVAGSHVVSRGRIENNGFVFAEFHDSYKMVIQVALEKSSSCSATVDYALLSGRQYFEARSEATGAATKDTAWRAEGVTCQISEV
jgi:hypothetical protein